MIAALTIGQTALLLGAFVFFGIAAFAPLWRKDDPQ